MPPWILVITTLASGGYGGSSPSIETATIRIANEVTCRTMSEDFTYERVVDGIRLKGRARCYLDAPDVAIPGRP